jgi:predicted O-methyltransferase YrrM
MSEEVWSAVDRYINHLFVPADPILDETIHSSAAAGLPAINVTPSQGMLLNLLARMQKAHTILEIGTLGAYSTIWLARALPPGGRMITLEADPKHGEIARSNLKRAGLSEKVEVRLGRAIDTLPRLAADGWQAFDLIFIDADKMSIPDYFSWALKLSHPGSLIVVDNVVRNGGVIDEDSPDPAIQGVRRFNEMAAAEPRVQATTIQTVGQKGYDGFALLLVTGKD